MSLFTNDLETIQECFGSGILMMCDAAFLGILTVVKMWRMDVGLTLLALIPMALLLASGIIVGKYMTKKWETRQAAFSDLSDFSQESFSGIAVVKAFVKEAKELLAFRRLNKRNEEVNVSYTKASTLLNITVTLFVESVICIILGYGGYLVYQGQFDAGQLVEYIGYFTAMVWPVMAVSQLIEMTSRGKASLNRVSELLDAKQDVVDKPDVEDVKDIEGRIEFRHLTFRYPDGEFDVLKDVSFTIEPGENVGLVGKTGSGKTTIVDLILRTYNVPDGTIFLDGHDVNTIPIRDVRAAAAYVPQDNFLFSDTIEDNIAFAYEGEQAAEAEAAEEAARLAAVHDNIVGFKDRYMTMLGERGVTVSGGQKQRISIARALMKHAKILILDDSVSAVDTKTEQEILTNLKKNRAGLRPSSSRTASLPWRRWIRSSLSTTGASWMSARMTSSSRAVPITRRWSIFRNSRTRGGSTMREYYPLIVVGGVIGLISIVFSLAYALIKNKKEAIGFDRNMKDGEIVRRLLAYAKPHWRSFVFAGLCMAFSIAYDIASPLLIGYIEEIVSTEFELSRLFLLVGIYAGILVVSLASSYAQAIVLQKTGQRILSSCAKICFRTSRGSHTPSSTSSPWGSW